jgi:hypothetical protein
MAIERTLPRCKKRKLRDLEKFSTTTILLKCALLIHGPLIK